jgi:hypothetical protein
VEIFKWFSKHCVTIRKVNDYLLLADKETSQSREDMELAVAFGPINI